MTIYANQPVSSGEWIVRLIRPPVADLSVGAGGVPAPFAICVFPVTILLLCPTSFILLSCTDFWVCFVDTDTSATAVSPSGGSNVSNKYPFTCTHINMTAFSYEIQAKQTNTNIIIP